jgi:hypothetical protein
MLYTQPAPLQIWEKDSEILGRHYLQELLTTYPADVVTRWYSSVLTALRGLDPAFYGAGSEAVLRTWRATLEPFYRFMYACAPWLALAGMLLLAARRMWSALALMLVLVYFLGYPSLSFQLRHTYHLSFAFLLLPGVVIDRLVRTVIDARSEGHDVRAVVRKAFSGIHGMGKPAVQVAGFIGVVLLIFWLPWKAAGVVQAPHVEDLWARCETADLEAFEAEAVAEGERWKTYTPVALPDLKTSSELPAIIERMFAIRPLRDYVCEYLVLDLEAPDGYFEVGYDYTESWYNMVATHQLPEGQTRVRYFFPVFSVTDEFVPSYEAGVPEFEKFRVSQDVVVHGMYRVRDRSQFPFLMNIWHTEAPEDFSGWALDL